MVDDCEEVGLVPLDEDEDNDINMDAAKVFPWGVSLENRGMYSVCGVNSLKTGKHGILDTCCRCHTGGHTTQNEQRQHLVLAFIHGKEVHECFQICLWSNQIKLLFCSFL